MIKIAEDFFKNQSTLIEDMDSFWKSDLCLYFEKLYKTKLVLSDNGFIKVIRREDYIVLYENVFYDWADEKTSEYINFEGVKMRPGSIKNTPEGKQLSELGYCVFENMPESIKRNIYPVTKLMFNPDGCDRPTEPNAMFKYSPKVWGEIEWMDWERPKHVEQNAYDLFKSMEYRMSNLLEFSNVLSSMDAYDMICLKWSDGRSILPHNDLDIRMFVNLISYWDETNEHRYLKVGDYDWYDYLFPILLTDDWEATNNITASKKELGKILSHRYSSPMVNVFNPRFYHETTPLKSGSMYSISAHKSFKAIVDKMELVR